MPHTCKELEHSLSSRQDCSRSHANTASSTTEPTPGPTLIPYTHMYTNTTLPSAHLQEALPVIQAGVQKNILQDTQQIWGVGCQGLATHLEKG